jgi:hypothetical protein
MIGLVTVQNKPQQISKMKKFIILLSLIATTILLTSCESDSIQSAYCEYNDKYCNDWASDYFSTNTE